jgi:hypothetical protein
MRILIVIILMLLCALAHGQTHTMPGSNVVPSGASLTINSGASITAAAGSTVTGFGSGGGSVSITATAPIIVTPSPLTGTGVVSLNATSKSNWDTAFTQMLQWDGGSTNLVAATARTSLALVPGTNVAPATSGSSILYGNGSGGFSNVTVGTGLTFTTGTLTASGGTAGNPTAKVGTSAVNGSASTFMRSDGAPPIDQTVNLGMTAAQSMTVTDAVTSARTIGLTVGHNSSGTPGANYGTTIRINGKSDTTVDTAMADVSALWQTAADASRVPVLALRAYNFAGTANPVYVWPGGGISTNDLTDPGTTIIMASNGFKVSNTTAPAGRFLKGNGTSFVDSGYKLPTTISGTGTILQSNGTDYAGSTPTWPTTAGTAGYTMRSDGTNVASYPQDMMNSATAVQLSVSTSDIYITGSSIVVAAGDFKLKGQYRCVFDMTKSAGTGIPVITLRVGTAGTTSDPAILTFTLPAAGTSVADTGVFEIIATWKIVGASAAIGGILRAQKNTTTAAGLWGTISDALTIVPAISSSFNSTAATTIGVSFNGGTAFAGSSAVAQATLVQ